MSYNLKKDESGQIEILTLNGKTLFCPFKPTLLVPGRLANEMQLHREPCGTWCGLFKASEKSVTLCCGNEQATHYIQPENKIAI
jgi:hypothetical protein